MIRAQVSPFPVLPFPVSVFAEHARLRIASILLLSLLLLSSCADDDGPVDPPPTGTEKIELRVHELINEYRAGKGLGALTTHSAITEESRTHSKNMAEGTVEFGHDGFADRIARIRTSLPLSGGAENVAFNSGYDDPAQVAFDGWIDSDGHRKNIEGNYDKTGIGAAQSPEGAYYLTQIFVKSK